MQLFMHVLTQVMSTRNNKFQIEDHIGAGVNLKALLKD